MENILENCILARWDNEKIKSSKTFSCGNDDLDEFFNHDAPLYSYHLLGRSYCFCLKENTSVVTGVFTVSNDSIRVDSLPNSRGKKVEQDIPYVKKLRRYPAVLIGRLGVNMEFRGVGVGSQILDFIKAWFLDKGNKTGCRFVIVDAYNNDDVLNFYSHNGFKFLFSTEEQEAEFAHWKKGVRLNTRQMFFDLFSLVE